MSHPILLATDAVAHIERDGSVVLTTHGKLILCLLFIFIAMCTIGIIIAIAEDKRKR